MSCCCLNAGATLLVSLHRENHGVADLLDCSCCSNPVIFLSIAPVFPPTSGLSAKCMEQHTFLKRLFFPTKIMFLRSIQVVSCVHSLFLFIAENYFIVWIYNLLFIPLLKDIWVFYSELLQVKLLWALLHRFLCKHQFLFLQDKCPGVQLMAYMIVACLVFRKIPNCFSGQLSCFTFPLAIYERFSFSTSSLVFANVSNSYFSCFNGHVVVSSKGFLLHFYM